MLMAQVGYWLMVTQNKSFKIVDIFLTAKPIIFTIKNTQVVRNKSSILKTSLGENIDQ